MTFGELIIEVLERSCEHINDAIRILKTNQGHLIEYTIEDLLQQIKFLKEDIETVKQLSLKNEGDEK